MSHRWEAVVHPFCVQARVGRPCQVELDRGVCSFYPDRCPIPFGGRYCVCPALAGCNAVIVARRFGQPTVKVPTYGSSAETSRLARHNLHALARRHGLGTMYRGVPPRENPDLDALRGPYGWVRPGFDLESYLNEPSDWWAPPESLTIDVDRTIREGRFIIADTPDDDG